jgi:hypothetical protein
MYSSAIELLLDRLCILDEHNHEEKPIQQISSVVSARVNTPRDIPLCHIFWEGFSNRILKPLVL